MTGALVVVSADDPGMASSQNEQDNRRYAVAAGVPMLEPSDSQEAYDFTLLRHRDLRALGHVPVLLRMTTRVCHSKTVVRPAEHARAGAALRAVRARHPGAGDDPGLRAPGPPALARRSSPRSRTWNETSGPELAASEASRQLGIITSGVACMHAREAAPDAAVLKLGMTYPAAHRGDPRVRGRRWSAAW